MLAAGNGGRQMKNVERVSVSGKIITEKSVERRAEFGQPTILKTTWSVLIGAAH
jgi:hypothetical protein